MKKKTPHKTELYILKEAYILWTLKRVIRIGKRMKMGQNRKLKLKK